MNKQIILFIAVIMPVLVILSGCGRKRRTSADFNALAIGMTKEQVRATLGEPDEVRGSTIDQAGSVTSVWSYDVYRRGN